MRAYRPPPLLPAAFTIRRRAITRLRPPITDVKRRRRQCERRLGMPVGGTTYLQQKLRHEPKKKVISAIMRRYKRMSKKQDGRSRNV